MLSATSEQAAKTQLYVVIVVLPASFIAHVLTSERFETILFHVFVSLQWVLDKQDLMKERQKDLKFLTEEEYWKLQIFFANGICYICLIVIDSLPSYVDVVRVSCVCFRKKPLQA